MKSLTSMIDVDIVTYFFAGQSINLLNSLKTYFSTDFRSFSFLNETSTMILKTCLLLIVIVNSFSLNAMYLILKYLMF
jgi:hypothetical protein